MKVNLLFIPIIFLSLSMLAQHDEHAKKLFNAGNFFQALNEYDLLLESDSNNHEWLHHLAVCYLNTNGDKSRAVPLLEKLLLDVNPNPVYRYLMGRAYHYDYNFSSAIQYFKMFIRSNPNNKELINSTNEHIEYCINAKELMKYPVDVSFENLGKNINSSFDDYYPFVNENESYIQFNSKRNKFSVEEISGQFKSNVYISNVSLGKYQKAKLLSEKINTEAEVEEIVGMNSIGSKSIIYKEDYVLGGELYLADFNQKSVTSIKQLGNTIISKYAEIAACISDDNQKLFFASDRPGGYGGVDLYLCQRLPNGKWSEPNNLGPYVNTYMDEDFPSISADGKTLYFSSKGHSSMGGYDIFRAKWDVKKSKFSFVQNMGYPINTPEDNLNFRLAADNRFAYVSAVRKEGYGGLDIYRIKFKSVEPEYTVIKGHINTDTTSDSRVDITITDTDTYEVYGEYTPNDITQRYIIILPPGKYFIDIDSEGFSSISEEIEVFDKQSFKPEIIKNIYLKSK
jgi:tetratricopeptide (TPR) repeat protein